MLGPIDYMVVSFDGNNFDGSILSELVKASDAGTVRVVDMVFAMKEANGDVTVAEISDQPKELQDIMAKLGFDDETPFVTEGDLFKVAEDLENDSSAGVLVLEHLWAKDLKKAFVDAGASLVDYGRIQTDVVEGILKDMELMDEVEAEEAAEGK